MTCKDCKYLYIDAAPFSASPDLGLGRCSNPLLNDDTGKVKQCPDNGVYASCDEGRGELIVGPNFGCIHFEKKNQ